MNMLTHDDIAQLTAPERLALIGELWDSLTENETPLPKPQLQELQRRLVSFETDRPQGVGWAHLKAELSERAP